MPGRRGGVALVGKERRSLASAINGVKQPLGYGLQTALALSEDAQSREKD